VSVLPLRPEYYDAEPILFQPAKSRCVASPDGFGWFENSQLADKYLLLQRKQRDGVQSDQNLAEEQTQQDLLGRCYSSKMSDELHGGIPQQKSPA